MKEKLHGRVHEHKDGCTTNDDEVISSFTLFQSLITLNPVFPPIQVLVIVTYEQNKSIPCRISKLASGIRSISGSASCNPAIRYVLLSRTMAEGEKRKATKKSAVPIARTFLTTASVRRIETVSIHTGTSRVVLAILPVAKAGVATNKLDAATLAASKLTAKASIPSTITTIRTTGKVPAVPAATERRTKHVPLLPLRIYVI
ncbi:hypothetical protein K501DRAFT_278268 [Backusella circina FSU 941]|nr:hypothetical protein K501DRAFT_278268 [Backusella circina FSU 941]